MLTCVALDEWSDDEIDHIVDVGGNSFANSIYEAYFPEGVSKPGPNASHEERLKFVRMQKEEALNFRISTTTEVGQLEKNGDVQQSYKSTSTQSEMGAKEDGTRVYFFHKTANAYATGQMKRRKIQNENSSGKEYVRWHKIRKTKPVVENGTEKGRAKEDGTRVYFFHKTANAYATGQMKRRKIQNENSSGKEYVRWHKIRKTKPVVENGTEKGRAKEDGTRVYFFHKTANAYATGQMKRRKIQNENSSGKEYVRWHKIRKTKPVVENGTEKGSKKIMVLYRSAIRGSKSGKSNWVMHQLPSPDRGI
ncbi:hypothetical protein POM88_020383 [Heracleum sosnowskyi]|uniref:NAC domain-containing protein n=1 Tax=Heracleum sosnowskyi TaxID=360622 RepID=A0AAD8IE00_9APIA|nr:hypothetical protein POM88_020383 [Heracleum sosnowskyi]